MPNNSTKSLNLDRRTFLAGSAAGLAAMKITIPGGALAQGTYPDGPITVVVMYSAGGGTDTIMRALADEMASAMGWTVNVVNMPGAVGGVATLNVAGEPADGYTVLGGANYNKFVRVMGHVDLVPWEHWAFFQAANAIASWSVPIDSPFETFEDVVAAAQANPGTVTISTSGTGGLWHELAMIVASFANIEMRYVPYQGGQPATLAGLQGEVDVAGGGVHEHIELIRAGELRCLQQTGSEDIVLEDGTVLPSVGNFLPNIVEFLPIGGTYNFIVRRDTPIEILREIQAAFIAAANSDGFREMVDRRFFQLDVVTGEAADRRAAQLEVITVDTFNRNADAIGAEILSADDLNLPTPADFDGWWPPAGYTPLDL